MSNAVFPTFPGLKWGRKRTAVWSTNIQKSASGREIRSAYYTYPQWKFSLSFEVLRTKASINELEKLAGFFNERRGSFDSFLYEDPADNKVADQLIGNVVQGVTRYQLVRNYGGFTEPVLAVKGVPVVKVGGVALATTPKNGTPESKFIVNADRFGVGSTGKADVFPFVVDTQKNRVGVNGELVVNGKAIIDRLNAGDIHGDKITANTLNANRLKAGSVTAREISVDKLSAISANMGDIRGGRMDLGNGRFVVESNGDVSLSSSSGQVGMKLNNERITVRDPLGYLRVIVGYKGIS